MKVIVEILGKTKPRFYKFTAGGVASWGTLRYAAKLTNGTGAIVLRHLHMMGHDNARLIDEHESPITNER